VWERQRKKERKREREKGRERSESTESHATGASKHIIWPLTMPHQLLNRQEVWEGGAWKLWQCKCKGLMWTKGGLWTPLCPWTWNWLPWTGQTYHEYTCGRTLTRMGEWEIEMRKNLCSINADMLIWDWTFVKPALILTLHVYLGAQMRICC
jgi:hypothetical protein